MLSVMLRYCVLSLFVIFLSAGIVAAPAAAQSNASLAIMAPVTQEREKDVVIVARFFLRDQDGDALPNVEISQVTMQLQGTDAQPVVAQVTRPEEPLFVTLLIDISGSMADNIQEVKAAAQNAIAKAPPESRIAVIQFNGESRTVQGFTQDRAGVRSAIERIDQPAGATCLYDTIYTALELLGREERNNPPSRRAVIAFTDGRDVLRNDSSEPCSRHSYDEVVAAAERQETPVHTIGIYSQPGDIDAEELRNLAQQTDGFSALGSRDQVGGLFDEIFRGLGVQYVAQATLKPPRGSQQVILAVTPRGAPQPILGAFAFTSSRDYATTPTPVPSPTPQPTATSTPWPDVGVRIESIQADAQRSVYDVTINTADPRLLDRLLLTVEEDSGQQRYSAEIIVEGMPVIVSQIPFANLRDGREYTIRIQGVRNGELVPRPTEQVRTGGDDPFILVEKTFTHEILPLPPVTMSVKAVNEPDFINNTLSFEIEVNDPARVPVIHGEILQDNVRRSEWRDPYEGPLMTIDIPPDMLASAGPADYQIRICGQVISGDRTGEEACSDAYEFAFTPPRRPGFFRRMYLALERNPLIWGGILVVLFGLAGWLFWGGRRKKNPYQLDRAPVEHTLLNPAVGASGSSGGGRGPRLRIRVTQTPAAADRVERVVTKFPCTIGRQENCDITIVGDRQISRRHARFILQNDEFFIEDLKSAGGTFVDNVRLAPGARQKLQDVQVIQLGKQTNMEVRIQYS
ncbi:MAG: VWA domain-containing protein [Caldilineaceae bacterium]|nr:VWA domain-containing protein [Caldilineaceae bacterium]